MEKVLREVLAGDKSLLSRKDDLIAALGKKVPANLMRDFAAIKKALSLNVGEKFFVGGEDREATKAEVAEILKNGGLQANRIDFVIDTFVKALDWDKPPAPAEEKISAEPTPAEPMGVAEFFKKAKMEQASTKQPTTPQTPPKQSKPLNLPPQPPQSPPPQPSQPPTTPPSQPSQGVNKNIIIGVLCALVVVMFLMLNKNSNAPSNSPSAPAQNVEQAASVPSPKNGNYMNARTELSLNGMDLGASADELIKNWGEPNQRERRDDGNFTYVYDTINVGIVGGEVHSFMTKDPAFKTLRGLHVGSTYGEVIDKYGTNSRDMNVDGLALHEYPFNSLSGKYSLLRFAINSSGLVDYISIRIVEEPPPPPPQTNSSSQIDENVRQAATAFLSFHRAITNKDYSAAFDLFTDERKANMNYNIRAFAQGYADTITSEIVDLQLVSKSDNLVVMDYVLDARDRAGGGRTLYQQFRGQVEMLRVGGEWKIAATQSRRVREVMER